MTSEVKRQNWIVAVSLTEIGENHVKTGIPNQDAVGFDFMNDDFVLAVSDGVGSCKKSEYGSSKAVSICIELFKEVSEDKISQDETILITEILRRWQMAFGDDCNEYCATLQTIMKFGKKAYLISLGDGFVAITSEGMKIISPDDKKAFTNETKCLSKSLGVEDFWTKCFDLDTNMNYTAIACTDGVSNAITQGSELDFVEEIEHGVTSERLESELKDFMADISNYSFDDKTLGVVKYERQSR